MNNVSVPVSASNTPCVVENRRINAANDPPRPIHMMPAAATEIFGNGPLSTERAPIWVTAIVTNPSIITNGNADSPTQ